jgi:hypothetical protein
MFATHSMSVRKAGGGWRVGSAMKFVAFFTLFAPAGAGDYLNEWAVHVEKGDGAAMRVAKDHGFANLGQVRLEQWFLFLVSVASLVRHSTACFMFTTGCLLTASAFVLVYSTFQLCARAHLIVECMEVGRLLTGS